jgi:hypothetical protein
MRPTTSSGQDRPHHLHASPTVCYERHDRAVGTLAFIDAMTGRLAWPLAAIVLGLIFRRSLTGLLGRVRKLRYREAEAELAELAEATQGVQDAVEEAAKPLPEDAEEGEQESRERIERLMRTAATWGFTMGKTTDGLALPKMHIRWDGDQPEILIDESDRRRAEAIERRLRRIALSEFFGTGVDLKGSYRWVTPINEETDKDILD